MSCGQVDDAGELVCGVSTQAGASKGDDVTGGMKLKLATAINVVVRAHQLSSHLETHVQQLSFHLQTRAFVPEEVGVTDPCTLTPAFVCELVRWTLRVLCLCSSVMWGGRRPPLPAWMDMWATGPPCSASNRHRHTARQTEEGRLMAP
jgi:hypothetical protein